MWDSGLLQYSRVQDEENLAVLTKSIFLPPKSPYSR